MEAAGLPESEDSFHPAVAFFRAGSLRALSPQDPEADHPFGMVVRRSDPFLLQKDPQVGDLPFQSAGKSSGCIPVVPIPGDEFQQSLVEGFPFFFGGRGIGHMTKALEFLMNPAAK